MRSYLIASLILLAGCARQLATVEAPPIPLAPAAANVANDLKSVVAASKADLGLAPAPQNPIEAIAAFADDDLRAALEDAQAHNDVAAVSCWSGILELKKSLPVGQAPPKGLASLVQRKRDLLGQAGSGGIGGFQRAFNLACAAMANDEIATLSRFGILLGGATLKP